MRSALKELLEKLEAWLPSESEEFVNFFFRLLASLPGGEMLEELGYKPFDFLGWREVELIAETLSLVKDGGDVFWLVRELLKPEGVEAKEA